MLDEASVEMMTVADEGDMLGTCEGCCCSMEDELQSLAERMCYLRLSEFGLEALLVFVAALLAAVQSSPSALRSSVE